MCESGFEPMAIGNIIGFRMEPGNRNSIVTDVGLISVYQTFMVDGEGDASVIQFETANFEAAANGIPPAGWSQATDSACGDAKLVVNGQITSIDDEVDRYIYNVTILDVTRE